MRARPISILPLLVLLFACGDLPEPFLGNPGATARWLARPTPMLAVPRPSGALLPGESAVDFANLLALSLQKAEIPALARMARNTDWGLTVTATQIGDKVVPRYAIVDPTGREQGAIDGAATPALGWAEGRASALGEATNDAVPRVRALMTSIRATRDRADPNSLYNRPARVFVPPVTGAPGDGDFVLTSLIRANLSELGPLIQTAPGDADFTVRGEVAAGKPLNGKQQIEIVWTVTRADGDLSGKVAQLNSVSTGLLDRAWGGIASVVAQEAAGGIGRVLARQAGRDPDKPGPHQPDAK